MSIDIHSDLIKQVEGERNVKMTTEEDKAREEAEARRRRILEEADGRLGIVTGENPAGGGDKDGKEESDDKPSVKSSGAARMAAARRRRFKKGAKKETAEKEEKSEDATAETPAPKPTPTGAGEKKGEDEPAEADAPTPKEKEQEPRPTETDKENDGTEKKKYMGVAKMRRRMIKEKQQKLAEEKTNAADGMETKAATPSIANLKKKKKKVGLIGTLPIIMHAVTILLLFFAGLDVGLQQDRSQTAIVQTELAPRQLGLKLIQSEKFDQASKQARMMMDEEVIDPIVSEDEFDADATEESDSDNLDPLFGVDLDLYTAGPGLLMWLARGAVVVHRLILKLVYYFPLRVLNALTNMATQLINTPPMFCLFALAIRQVVGKVVLGAKLPDKAEHENMIKQMISSAASRFFPTATGLYGAFAHLRSDMYVILCGLLVGLAWKHSIVHVPDVAVDMGIPDQAAEPMEEAVPVTEPITEEPGIVTGDEL